MNAAQPARAMIHLATLPLQTIGVATPKEHNDEER
jgi:hypothetical protein